MIAGFSLLLKRAVMPLNFTLNDRFPLSSTSPLGRDDSSASGSLREANIQRRLFGDELE